MFGRCGRAGQSALPQRQQHRDAFYELTPELCLVFEFYCSLLAAVKPSLSSLKHFEAQPFIMYTGASWKPAEMEIGLRSRDLLS